MLSANIENLTFTGTGPFQGTGNILANTITGGASNDILNGFGGNDTLIGGLGDDTYIVDSMAVSGDDDDASSGDVIVEANGAGNDTVLISGGSNYALGANLENLTYTGNYLGIQRFTADGNGLANTLTGGGGVDTLDGNAGNDSLLGLGGGDRIYGGGGNDRIDGGLGNDVLSGESGNDTFVFRAISGADVITDFDANPNDGQDFIELSGFGITSANFGSRVIIADVGADTLVTVDGDANQTILLSGVGNASTVTVDDFSLL